MKLGKGNLIHSQIKTFPCLLQAVQQVPRQLEVAVLQGQMPQGRAKSVASVPEKLGVFLRGRGGEGGVGERGARRRGGGGERGRGGEGERGRGGEGEGQRGRGGEGERGSGGAGEPEGGEI